MRTAIDTNVISAIWSGERSARTLIADLGAAAERGGLVICPVVYAELLAYPGATGAFVDRFLSDTRLAIDWVIGREIWEKAAERFSAYAERRRRNGSESKRLIADFLIGAHALLQADQLMTMDRARYRADFGELTIAGS